MDEKKKLNKKTKKYRKLKAEMSRFQEVDSVWKQKQFLKREKSKQTGIEEMIRVYIPNFSTSCFESF